MVGQRGSNAPDQTAEPSRLFLVASYIVLFIGGGVLGAFGALLLPYSVSSGTSTTTPSGGAVSAAHVLAASNGSGIGQLVSVGLLFALIANPALSFAGLWTAGTRLAAFTPLAGWLLVVLSMASGSSEGDLLLPSGLRSTAYLLVGAVTFIAVAAFGHPTRGVVARSGQPPVRGTPSKAPPAKSAVAKPGAVAKRASKAPQKSGARRTAPKGGRRR